MKKLLSLFISILLVMSFAGCGKSEENTNAQSRDKKEIVVGVSPTPHKEIMEKAAEILEKEGYKIKIVEFNDYQMPNIALSEGDIDANFFQHVPFLNKTNSEKKLNLDYTVKVHIEPMGVYSNKIKDIKELKDGATISVPNDPTNEARALRLLEKAGLIKLKSGEFVTKVDITENPKKYDIQEIEAAQLPRTLNDVDISVINTNFALSAGLNPLKDALLIEDKDSPYANVLAVRKEDKDKDYIKALSKALNSEEIRKFIEENYKGSIVPAF